MGYNCVSKKMGVLPSHHPFLDVIFHDEPARGDKEETLMDRHATDSGHCYRR